MMIFMSTIFVDFSKAFDTINHAILIDKLEKQYKFSNGAVNLLKNYLEGRTFQVKYQGYLSEPQPLKTGMPQGSKLRPLPYLMYMICFISFPRIQVFFFMRMIRYYLYAQDFFCLNWRIQQTNAWKIFMHIATQIGLK